MLELTDLKGVAYHTQQEYLTMTTKLRQDRILLKKPVTFGQWGPGLANGFAFNRRHKFVKLSLLPLYQSEIIIIVIIIIMCFIQFVELD